MLARFGAAVRDYCKKDLLLATVAKSLLRQKVAKLVQRPRSKVLGAEEWQGGGEPAKIVEAEAVQERVQDLHVEQSRHLPEVQKCVLLWFQHVRPQKGLSLIPGYCV